MKRSGILVALVAVLLISGCQNSNPPSYIKQVTCYEEGDGVVIYFILADEEGAMTSADGRVEVRIWQEWTDFVGWDSVHRTKTIYEGAFEVKASDFQKATIGMGAFEREVLLCSLGRLPKSRMADLVEDAYGMGQIQIDFMPAKPLPGKTVLTGKDSCSLPE